jgi:hypothetical protein
MDTHGALKALAEPQSELNPQPDAHQAPSPHDELHNTLDAADQHGRKRMENNQDGTHGGAQVFQAKHAQSSEAAFRRVCRMIKHKANASKVGQPGAS